VVGSYHFSTYQMIMKARRETPSYFDLKKSGCVEQ
jgi:hypothetical protein